MSYSQLCDISRLIEWSSSKGLHSVQSRQCPTNPLPGARGQPNFRVGQPKIFVTCPPGYRIFLWLVARTITIISVINKQQHCIYCPINSIQCDTHTDCRLPLFDPEARRMTSLLTVAPPIMQIFRCLRTFSKKRYD